MIRIIGLDWFKIDIIICNRLKEKKMFMVLFVKELI